LIVEIKENAIYSLMKSKYSTVDNMFRSVQVAGEEFPHVLRNSVGARQHLVLTALATFRSDVVGSVLSNPAT
jgi:hypothetical protein